MLKLVSTVAVLALTAGYAAAECNNMCSGHGICGANDACTCYRNWRGNDCSERTCQYGVSFVTTAQGDLNHDGSVSTTTGDAGDAVITQWAKNGGTFEAYPDLEAGEGHAYMECSNKGLCDRASGECVCFDGYEGSACQRTVCPNSCSGHGICRNIQDVHRLKGQGSLFDPKLAYLGATDYLLWDGLKNQACVCDPGYKGYDCSLRECPKGHDPLIDGMANQEQTITTSAASVAAGSFVLLYTDLFGEVWTTDSISTAYAGTTAQDLLDGAADVKAALENIPNSVIEAVTVTAVDNGADTGGVIYTVTFTKNAGALTQLSYKNAVLDSGTALVAADIVTAISAAATTTAQECSGRGLCDYDTGICSCFRGYRDDDCSAQSALAYTSSSL